MDRKAILAIVLSIIVLVVFQIFFMKPQPRQTAPAPGPAQTAQKDAGTPAAVSPKTETAPVPGAAAAAVKRTEIEKTVTVDTPLYTALFSTKGGTLKSLKLKQYRKDLKETVPVEMVNMNGMAEYPLAVTFPDSTLAIPADASYQADAESIQLVQLGSSGRLTFTVNAPGQLKIEKVFSFRADRYGFDLDIKVRNASDNTLTQKALVTWTQYVDPKAEEDSYGHDGPIFDMKDSLTTESAKKLEPRKVVGPDVSWGGYESKYFISAIIPKQPSLTNLTFGKDQRNMVFVGMEGPKNLIPPSQDGVFSYSIFMGPKDYDILKAQGVGLENSIDYGWVKWLALPLLITMKFLYNFIHNYGIIIVILTILIKIVFWPLGNKSYKSMKEMQKLQPKMNELKEKYKNDKAKLNQEVMQLYKTHKVNPMSGCLPMVIQIPVFFGLYKALLYSIELRHAPFIWWIKDLSAPDTLFGHIPLWFPMIGGFAIGPLPIVMGATMFWQQKLTPSMGDPMQQKLMLLMPIVFTFLFLNFPSGLVIYWLFNNILSIGQQYYINKKL